MELPPERRSKQGRPRGKARLTDKQEGGGRGVGRRVSDGALMTTLPTRQFSFSAFCCRVFFFFCKPGSIIFFVLFCGSNTTCKITCRPGIIPKNGPVYRSRSLRLVFVVATHSSVYGPRIKIDGDFKFSGNDSVPRRSFLLETCMHAPTLLVAAVYLRSLQEL